MILTIKAGLEIQQTDKTICIPIMDKGVEYKMWVPRSQVAIGSNTDLNDINSRRTVDIPQWLYDKKVEELFF